jgi:transposase
MEYFAGWDVAVEETSLCVIDQEGKVVLETSVATDPVAIFKGLKNYAAGYGESATRPDRCRHGCRSSQAAWPSGSLSQGLPHALCAVGDAQQDQQGGSARDRAHHAPRLVLRRSTSRAKRAIGCAVAHAEAQSQAQVPRPRERDPPLDQGIRAQGRQHQPRRVRGAGARAGGGRSADRLSHRLHAAGARRDELCQRFMRIPGVGPISALAFKTSIDDPRGFRRSKTVGAYLGLTSRAGNPAPRSTFRAASPKPEMARFAIRSTRRPTSC